MLILPGEAMAVALLALNQHMPLLSVANRQPALNQAGELQSEQHWSIELPAAEPSPGVCQARSDPHT